MSPAPSRRHGRLVRPAAAPDWYKDAIVYEVPVRAFRDSSGDGIGDFRGLTEKLDYLVDLGVTAIWLLPFYPSPGRDDGYDISDYTAVHPDYGTLADVRTFLAEAHLRGIRVIGEMVLNHTSDQHPWFQRARTSPPGSPWREYYVWSDTPDRYREARIIFRDFESSNWTWDPVAGAYFWHRFYSHQPDLNFENEAVHREILAAVDFWLDLGLDGLRLDAVPYLYEEEGTDCENRPATHAFLRELRRHVDERYGDRLLLAEANQWPEDAVAYFGDEPGDECHMAFHFPLMPRIFMALRTEDRFPVLDILEQTPGIPERAQWAIFLRNHDELTLEMVTDVERDYLYRAYARDPVARINLGIRRRLAPLAGTRRRLELLYGLLLSLPGTPFLYYGDEIGMGDNYFLGDRNAVRTPMQWSPDRNAGFSEANRQRLYLPLILDPEYHFESVNVAAQLGNPASLLWWMKRVIDLRRRHPALARGTFEIVPTSNRHVLAYLRRWGDETILVATNLSRYAQWFELDLATFAGSQPVELFGGIGFPPIGQSAYTLTLGPHSFLWFRIEAPVVEARGVPTVDVPKGADLGTTLVLAQSRRSELARAIADVLGSDASYLTAQPLLASTRVTAIVPIAAAERRIALVMVTTATQDADELTVPRLIELVDPELVAEAYPTTAVIAHLVTEGEPLGTLLDVTSDPGALDILAVTGVPGGQQPAGIRFRSVVRHPGGRGSRRRPPEAVGRMVRLVGRAGPPPHPEATAGLELARADALVEQLTGTVELAVGDAARVIGLVVAAREAGRPSFEVEAAASLDRLLDAAVASATIPERRLLVGASVLGLDATSPEDAFVGVELADMLHASRSAGRALADVHDVLARLDGTRPSPFHSMDRRAMYQAVRTQLGEAVEAFREMPPPADDAELVALVQAFLDARGTIDARMREIIDRPIDGLRIRRYGGPVTAGRLLREGTQFVVAVPDPDFRTVEDRTRPRSPLIDVAGVLLGLQEVALRRVLGTPARPGLRQPDPAPAVDAWTRAWWVQVGSAFVDGYASSLARPAILPSGDADRALLLDMLQAEIAIDRLVHGMRAGRSPDPILLTLLLDLAAPAGA